MSGVCPSRLARASTFCAHFTKFGSRKCVSVQTLSTRLFWRYWRPRLNINRTKADFVAPPGILLLCVSTSHGWISASCDVAFSAAPFLKRHAEKELLMVERRRGGRGVTIATGAMGWPWGGEARVNWAELKSGRSR